MRKLRIRNIVFIIALSILLSSVSTYKITIASFTARNIFLEDIPATSNYVVRNDGSYTWVIQDNGDIVNSNTNDDAALQYSIDQTTSNGGTVTVLRGTYSATVTLKNQVTLVLNKGVSSITVNIDAGADATLIDMESSIYKQWESGSLIFHIEDGAIVTSQNLTSTTLSVSDGTFGSISDYVAINSSGIWLTGTARKRKELIFEAQSIKLPSANAPTESSINVGASGNIVEHSWDFDTGRGADDQLFFVIHSPLDIDKSETVEFHLTWKPKTGWASGNYTWCLEYILKTKGSQHGGDYNASAGNPTTIQMVVTPSNDDDFIETEFTDEINMDADQTLSCRLYLDKSASFGDAEGQFRFVEIEYYTNSLGK